MQKRKGHIVVLLAFLVLLGMIACPVYAAEYSPTNIPLYNKTDVTLEQVYNVSHDASAAGLKIAMVRYTIPAESQVDFTLYYGNGTTVSGYSENHHINPLQTSSSVSLGGTTKEYTYIDTQPFYDYNLVGYAKSNNETAITGFMVYSLNYGALDNDLAVFYPVSNIGQNTIYKIEASCTKPFDIFITDASPADVAGGASKNPIDVAWEWINFALSIAGFVLGFALAILAWIKFLFIDNLLLVVALYISVTMAYSAMTCNGNVFKFYKNFFKFQRSLLTFIMELWNVFITIIATFRGIFRI
jgi:hypothetical protein